MSILRSSPTLAKLAHWIAFILPLFVYNIGFRYVGSGDTAPAELLPISLLNGDFDLREFISGDLPYWARRG